MKLFNHINLAQKTRIKIIMQVEHMTPIVKLNLKLSCWSSLCDYNYAYILVKGTTTVAGQGVNTVAIAVDRNDKNAIFKNYAPFSNCISEINSRQIDNVDV